MGFIERLNPLLNQQPLSFGVCFSKADLHSAPPDVTTGLVELSHCERPQLASVRGVPRGYSGSVLETAGGEHASLCPLEAAEHSLSLQVLTMSIA